MAKKTSIKKQLKDSEFQLPVSPLTPEERKLLKQKMREAGETFKVLSRGKIKFRAEMIITRVNQSSRSD